MRATAICPLIIAICPYKCNGQMSDFITATTGSSPCLIFTKQKDTLTGVFLFGGDYGTRTCDLMRVKHAL